LFLDIFRITLDSINKEIFESIKGKGHYDKIIEGFKILKDLNYEVFINIPFQTMDKDKIMNIVDFAMLNNIKTIRFSPIIKKDLFEDYLNLLECLLLVHKKYYEKLYYEEMDLLTDYNDFIETIKDIKCPGAIISININSDGGITRCPYDKFEIGNLYFDTLKNIWINNYDKVMKANKTCHISNIKTDNLFREFIKRHSQDEYLNLCLSVWSFQLREKKKACFRDLPCWYISFK